MASAQLDLQAVEFAHPRMTAPLFTDLTVQFPSGWTGIVGPNGAGKATLLKVAMGEVGSVLRNAGGARSGANGGGGMRTSLQARR